uniref:Probable prefoldin subunit 6 n=1 Tax=Cacopsylla melanoneura TaxID=428564 RepID=A0A8D8R1Y9_9HEMI
MVEEVQKKLENELNLFKQCQKEYQKTLNQRQMLSAQLNENESVQKELGLMKDGGGEVYKLIGPILVKQELEEAKQNIKKRIDYISSELKRQDDTIATLDTKQDGHRENLTKLQQQFQQEQMAKMRT